MPWIFLFDKAWSSKQSPVSLQERTQNQTEKGGSSNAKTNLVAVYID